MNGKPGSEADVELARELLQELMGAGMALAAALGSLIDDLPHDAFPGEDNAEVLLEMAAGTCAPVVRAAGEELCRNAIELAGALRDRFVADLRAAADAAAS